MSVMSRPRSRSRPQVTLSHVAIRLLKGALYRRDGESLWSALTREEPQVRDYFSTLNLQLEVNEGEGYAYLRSPPRDDGDTEARLPTLITRHQLSYYVSLILGLLRKRLAEFDATGSGTRLVLTRDEIIDLVKLYLPETGNEQKQRRRVNGFINRIVDLGYLRKMRHATPGAQPSYEVERILKEFVNTEWLARLEARLSEEVAKRQAATEGDGD